MSRNIANTPLDQQLPDAEELYASGQMALDIARQQGASGAMVSLGASTGLTTQLRNRELESVEFQRDSDLGVTVYFGQRRGHASTADLKPDSIREIVEAACVIARHTQEDPAAGLPDEDQLATRFGELDLDHPAALSVEQSRALALRCEDAAFAADPRIRNSEGATVNAHRGRDVLMNSLGFRGVRTRTDYSLSVAVIAQDEADMQRDYWYRRDLRHAAFDEPEQIGRTASERATGRLSPRKLGTRSAPVLFPPELARGLIGHLVSAASGGALYRRASFLLDSLGSAIMPTALSIRQRPHVPGRFGAGWFDGEGVATRDFSLVEEGVLQSWLLGSYAARKLGLSTTGNAGGAQTLEVSPTIEADAAALMQQAGSGLVLTELMGQGVSTSTGDYSRGAAGYWFENGEIAYPVAEITIAGNLLDMYRQIAAIGSDIDPAARILTGSILVDGMTIAGS